MKIIRPIEIEKCAACEREFDKLTMERIFTGRVKYICLECKRRGNGQLDARQKEWRRSARGQAIIEHCERNKYGTPEGGAHKDDVDSET